MRLARHLSILTHTTAAALLASCSIGPEELTAGDRFEELTEVGVAIEEGKPLTDSDKRVLMREFNTIDVTSEALWSH